MGKLVEIAKATATKYGIDPALVCAVCDHESGGWQPWAVRFEPAFYRRYTQPMSLSDTEEYTRAISWGLMQIMGETARELGFNGKYLSELCTPEVGIDFGCRKLVHCLAQAGGNVRDALLKYNGGSDPTYPDKVLAHYDTYK